MLILVRKPNQGIWIDGDILIQVLHITRDRVKLGISAPQDVKVMRQELFPEQLGVPQAEGGDARGRRAGAESGESSHAERHAPNR